MADEIARESGICEPTDRHWQVINFILGNSWYSSLIGTPDALPTDWTRLTRPSTTMSRSPPWATPPSTSHVGRWLPGVSAIVTHKFAAEMEKLDIPPIPEFIEMIADSGAGLYACKASVDMFGLTIEDFIPQVQDIITLGEFYGLAAAGQIIFT
jgi:DsrE/DsrF/DrsH-like family